MAAQTIPPSDELTRRIRAAAAYGGFKSVEAFAAEVGMGRTTLYRVFREERGLKEMEARQMLAVAGLPLNFFEADFSSMGKPPMPPSGGAGSRRESRERSSRPRLSPGSSTHRNSPLLQSRREASA